MWNLFCYTVSLPNHTVFVPMERQASMQASTAMLPKSVSEEDASLAAILMDFLKIYLSSRSTRPNSIPPVSNPAATEPSNQSPAVYQSDTATKASLYSADSFNVYRMSSTPRGFAVIIHNEVFSGTLKTRYGSKIDADNLCRLFKWLGYEVKLFANLTAKQMLSTLRQLARLDHRNVDSVVLCILTHGAANDRLYGIDKELISIESVLKLFNGYNSPTLVGKPKIVLLQANRGDVFDYGMESLPTHPQHKRDSDPSGTDHRHTFDALKTATEVLSRKKDLECDHEEDVHVLPAEANFVIVYATPPGYVSWRNSAFGSWFIKAFVDVMYEHAAKCHFLEILTFLNHRLGRKFESRGGVKQIAETTFRLMKLLYFNPPSPPSHMTQQVDESEGCAVPVSDPADPQWTLP